MEDAREEMAASNQRVYTVKKRQKSGNNKRIKQSSEKQAHEENSL